MEKIETPVNSVDVICAATNMSLTRLAQETGIPAMTLEKLRMTGNVSIHTLERLAEQIGVTPDDIMYGNLAALTRAGGKLPVAGEDEMRRQRYDMLRRGMQYGLMGEDYALEQERRKLADTPYAEGVSKSFADNYEPFDILSFDAQTGEPIMIEVKATRYGADRKFVMSRNEIRLMEDCMASGRRYELHRVHHVHDPARRGTDVYTPEQLKELYDIEPYTYLLKRKAGGGKNDRP